ncbi:MAG: Uma2 family endonuclease [Rhodobacteraceae bacterium]|nr:Uma2 family endonuclease [Paracoccaceae bacterium]
MPSTILGVNADGWYAARRKGRKEKDDFEAGTPPDLVVEVEVSHSYEDKPQHHAELGVPEMWRINGERDSDRFKVEFLDLQEAGGPKTVEESLVLNRLGSSVLPDAFRMARSGNISSLSVLLKDNPASVNNLEPDEKPDSSPSTLRM